MSTKKDLIKINEKYYYESDKYNWVLYYFSGEIIKKTGKPAVHGSASYHTSLDQMLTKVLDNTLKTCDSFDNIVKTLVTLGDYLKEFKKETLS